MLSGGAACLDASLLVRSMTRCEITLRGVASANSKPAAAVRSIARQVRVDAILALCAGISGFLGSVVAGASQAAGTVGKKKLRGLRHLMQSRSQIASAAFRGSKRAAEARIDS